MNKYNNSLKIVYNNMEESTIEKAYDISLKNFSKEDIMRILTTEEDEQKIIPVINIESIDSAKEAEIVLDNLVGKDGRVREAVSYILSELPESSKYMEDKKSKTIIINALLDINPNVVRNMISFIEQSGNFKESLSPLIIKKTEEVIENLSKFLRNEGKFKENKEKSQKNHAKNKLTFNLYWLLSSISVLDVNNIKNLENILTKASNFLDYTIREKTALILSKMEKPPSELLQKLKQDKNIYVKNQLL